jgi:hypothetical protein
MMEARHLPLISESNHFLCCGSAIDLLPRDHTVPRNGHADLIWSQNRQSKIVCSVHWVSRSLFAVGRLYCRF